MWLNFLSWIVRIIQRHIQRKYKFKYVEFSQVESDGIKIKGSIKEMELREGQQVVVTAELKTAFGHDATYEKGSATWESSNPDIATVEVNPENELSATVTGKDGQENEAIVIVFRADGDPDSDQTRDIVGTLDVTVTRGEAVVVELKAGAPVDV